MCGVGVGYLVNHFQPDDEPSWFVTVAKSWKTGPSTQWIFEQSNQMINLFQNFNWAGILNLGKANVKKIWKNLRNLTDGWYFTKHIYNLFSAQSNIFYFLPKHLNAIHKGLRESIVGLGENDFDTQWQFYFDSSHRFCLSLHPLNVFGEESFPCVALQLRKGGEQGGLEEVLREVLVQHVLQRDRLCAINLTKEKFLNVWM